MLSHINSIIAILIVGSLILLSFLLITNPLKVNRKANLFLGGYSFAWSSFWFDELLLLVGPIPKTVSIDFFFITLQVFTPILFFYSILYFTNPYRKFVWIEGLHLILPFLVLLSFITQLEINEYLHWKILYACSLLLQGLYYTINAFFHLKKHEKDIELFNSNREEVDLRWIKQIILSLIIICIIIILFNLIYPQNQNLNIIANVPMLIIIFYITYQSMAQKEIFLVSKKELESILDDKKQDNNPSKNQLIAKEDLESYKEKLSLHMENEKPYLEGDLSLSILAKQIELSPHHLSFLLNEGFGKNFFQFVNSYRVNEAQKLLVSQSHQHLSIIGIAYEAGFNSKTAFNTVFKSYTGMTPTLYKKNSSLG